MRSTLFFFGVFAFIGLITLALACLFAYMSIRDMARYETAPAELVGFSDNSNDPIVRFSYQGRSHEFYSNFKSSDMSIGDQLTVHFPPGSPDKAEIKDFFTLWFLPGFFGLFALAFGGVGFYGISKQVKRMGAKRDLFDNQNGKKVSLSVNEVKLDRSYSVNKKHPFIVVCLWTDPLTNISHEFRSDFYWYDPSELLSGRKIDVYIDENDPSRYYMDTKFLPRRSQRFYS